MSNVSNPYRAPEPEAPKTGFADEFFNLTAYEKNVIIHGAIWFFLILFSYYILRPIREQISSTYGIENLSWMFWATFGVMLVAIPLYSFLVGAIDRKLLVPCIYLFFIANLIAFWQAMTRLDESFQIWVARAFFIWISFYGLFIVSFFWSIIGDMLTSGQGRKYFGFMAGGGTIGGLAGSQVAAQLVERIGVANLLLFPIALLTIALVVYWLLERAAAKNVDKAEKESTSGKATGGNPFAGFTAVFRSRYLAAICLYGVFLATCGTTVYFQQSEIVNAAYAPVGDEAEWTDVEKKLAEAQRTQYFANINMGVSIVTLIMQFFVVNLVMKHAGLGWALAALPIAYVIGITSLALAPTIGVLAVVSVLGRSAEYGICNPAREVLFTSVNREDRYKAKSFIDTIVRRGGDTLVGSLYRGLRGPLGLAMTTLSWIMIPVAIAWAGLAFFIDKENRRIEEPKKNGLPPVEH